MIEDINRIRILNSVVDLINVDQLHEKIKLSIDNNKKLVIGNLNINAANISFKDDWYNNFINNICEIVFCDGKGIQLGARLLGRPVPEHITYHTWIWQLFEFCNYNKYSLFLLGSKPGVAELALDRINIKYPDLKIGYSHGFFNKEGKENIAIIDKINNYNTNILIVGFGMPLQEKWIVANKDKINANIYLNGGAFLEWISGAQRQAPKWVTKCYLEWFYRLIKDPIRLWKRYILGNPLFIYRIIREKIGLL